MDIDLTTRIANHPKYQELKAKRTSFGMWLTLAMMAVYFGFILLVAFNKPFLATRLGAGVMTYAMPIAVQLVGCFSVWPRSAPAAQMEADTPNSAARDRKSVV